MDMLKSLMDPGPHGTLGSIGLLVTRVIVGGLLFYQHGWSKLIGFKAKVQGFPDPIGLGSELSLGLTVGAEVVCAGLIVLGLFTRLAALPIVFLMVVAAFWIHGAQPLSEKELALLYLAPALLLVFNGAGRYSIDGMVHSK